MNCFLIDRSGKVRIAADPPQMRGIPDMYALEGGIPLKGYGNSVGIQAKDSFDIPKTIAQENIQHRRKRKGVQGKAER